jgi:dTDP-glucose 4,6-dehydratase
MTRHIITGGAGFTAAFLVQELLPRGEEIVLFDSAPIDASMLAPGVRAVCGDVRSVADLAGLALGSGDTVYHLAARQFAGAVPGRGERDAWFADVNVVGVAKLIEVMEQRGASRLIFFSTDMTYGIPRIVPVPPSHPQQPLGPYGRSKLQAETLIRSAQARGMAATVFRPRLIAGRGRLGVLTKLFQLIRLGLPVPLIGSGNNRYQMVSVRDCARVAVKAMEMNCPSGFFNLGSSSPPRSRDLLTALIAHAGSRSIVVPTPAVVVKRVLALLDVLGLPLMYPEQYGIADRDILLDTSATAATFSWEPSQSDIDILIDAYDGYLALSGHKESPAQRP